MSSKTKYSVRLEKTTKVTRAYPIELEDVPCWTVTRMTDGMGWHIGKYADEATAQAVAGALTKHIAKELD